MNDLLQSLNESHGLEGDAEAYFQLARSLENDGDYHQAATAYDRAFGLSPERDDIKVARNTLLDQLSVREHGIVFRYVPSGTYLMGSDDGDPDEQPTHPVFTNAFWISAVPVSWATYCDLMDWEAAPNSYPKVEPEDRMDYFMLSQANKIRRQYCEDGTLQARDWHAHAPESLWKQGDKILKGSEIFGGVQRENPDRPWQYDTKPMVAISWQAANDLCENISDTSVTFRLPTEAEWEKAARGGLIGAKYSWGNQPPTQENCDFNHFGDFFIKRSTAYSPNHYGLYAMSGCVWEWTSDWYHSDAYSDSDNTNPTGPVNGEEKVLRGGSWSDDASAVTVSFRQSRPSKHWLRLRGTRGWSQYLSPNIGFRICRISNES